MRKGDSLLLLAAIVVVVGYYVVDYLKYRTSEQLVQKERHIACLENQYKRFSMNIQCVMQTKDVDQCQTIFPLPDEACPL